MLGRESTIDEKVLKALHRWEKMSLSNVNYVSKGSNPFTEHYSPIRAEVPDPQDPTTHLNVGLIDVLINADIVIVCGEASTHCVRNGGIDIANEFGNDHVQKLIFLKDCMSPVPGFEDLETEFFKDMINRGAKVIQSTDLLAML